MSQEQLSDEQEHLPKQVKFDLTIEVEPCDIVDRLTSDQLVDFIIQMEQHSDEWDVALKLAAYFNKMKEAHDAEEAEDAKEDAAQDLKDLEAANKYAAQDLRDLEMMAAK